MKKQYKYKGTFSIIVYEDGKAKEILPGMTVELKTKPNKYFVEVPKKEKKETTKDTKYKKKTKKGD